MCWCVDRWVFLGFKSIIKRLRGYSNKGVDSLRGAWEVVFIDELHVTKEAAGAGNGGVGDIVGIAGEFFSVLVGRS